MGFCSALSTVCGFGVGVSFGLTVGYFLFINRQSTDIKDPDIRPLAELDPTSLQQLLPEIPLWVKNPDYDCIDWLNRFIAQFWPYLDKAICKTAKTIAESIIAEQISKYKIKSVKFQVLSLGSLPPTFQGIKVYITDEEELIMEPSVKWAGNPNVTVAVKAFGLKATIQVVDLHVFALPRITLKPLVPSFPCFSKILVSLMEKPHVDFGLKLMGVDLMSIPGLHGFVQKRIRYQVATMYMWPQTLEIQILDPTKAQKRPVGIIHVKVVRAVNLRKKDYLGSSDPYVKLRLTETKTPSKKTTIRHNDLNPEWNEDFNLVVKDPETQALELLVYDWEQVGKHGNIGMNVIPLKELPSDEPIVMTLDLLKTMNADAVQNSKSRGQLEVELIYKPFKEDDLRKDLQDSQAIQNAPEETPAGGGLLVVIVHEAEDVEGEHHTNPYVRVIFEGEKRKTKGAGALYITNCPESSIHPTYQRDFHVKQSRDPRWGEEFQFMLVEPPTNKNVHVEVLSKPSRMGALHPKESLGYVHIPLNDVVNNKRINHKFHLIGSKNGRIQIELHWRTAS